MITGFFLQLFYVLVITLTGLLPTLPLPLAFTEAIFSAVGFVNQFSFIVPVQTLLTVIGLALSFHLALLIFDFTLWVIHLVRGR